MHPKQNNTASAIHQLQEKILNFKANGKSLIFSSRNDQNSISIKVVNSQIFLESDLYREINEFTSFLDNNIEPALKIKAIFLGVEENELCPICQKATKKISPLRKFNSSFFQSTCGSPRCISLNMLRNRKTTDESRKNHSVSMLAHKMELQQRYQLLLDSFRCNNFKVVEIDALKKFIRDAFASQKGNGLIVKEHFYIERIDELATILQLTKFIDIPNFVQHARDLKLVERMHCVLNDIKQQKCCIFCRKNEVKFNNQRKQYEESCQKCASDKFRTTRGLKTSQQISVEIEAKGFKVLQFPNFENGNKLIVQCNECQTISQHTARNGNLQHIDKFPLCSKCDKYSSKPEKELRRIIEQCLDAKEEVKFNDRSLISPLELDIAIPSRKIAFEFNGLYWHSDEAVKSNYHAVKTIKCGKIGYSLYQIFENEWLFSRQLVEARIKAILGRYERKVSARKCTIIISKTTREIRKFYTENSMYQFKNSSMNVLLHYNDQLVFVLSVAKARHNKQFQHELTQFCSKSGWQVYGALSRSLKALEEQLSIKSIVFYCDSRWSNGKTFERLGFTLQKKTSPVGYFFKQSSRDISLISPLEIANGNIKKFVEKYDSSKSDAQNMKDNGYSRIFDCGKMIFVKNFT